MAKRAHHYRLRLEHLAPASPEQPIHAPLTLDFDNHDDILQIVERMEARQLFATPGQASEFAIGLKLFSEVLLKNREHPLFTEFRPAFSAFMKKLKSGANSAEQIED
ncbi:DUF3861 domain-containing protein [Hymenobacter norwichensis]|uniref:DUF3861 domain-containing protein n=1 Tax=Hymenobacter norwichensis TaxID=223903 RepID=UPI0003B44E5A|nr:DUF3861 domain-containing protein [Hymenobacter norwichensis]